MEPIVARSVSGENPHGPHVTRITWLGGQPREILAGSHPELPVIWMSGYPRDAVMEGDLLGDDQVFLQKPVGVELLLSAAARLTGRDGARGSG
jgi:hypothetical protein